MRSRFPAVACLCLALLVMTGCSKRYRIQIESDTCWHGTVNGDQNISDCGNSTYKVIGPLRCVILHKDTAEGYLRVRIDSRPWIETTVADGIVQACE